MGSNVYFVRSDSSSVLIDTGLANGGQQLQEAADSLNSPLAFLRWARH